MIITCIQLSRTATHKEFIVGSGSSIVRVKVKRIHDYKSSVHTMRLAISKALNVDINTIRFLGNKRIGNAWLTEWFTE